MVKLNENYDKLAAAYLFKEIGHRVAKFLEENPHIKKEQIIRLGIGDVTEPINPSAVHALKDAADEIAIKNPGYGDSPGVPELVERIAGLYASRGVTLNFSQKNSDIFVSAGAKEDSSNLQHIFSIDNIVAVQDPVYPVYVDSNVMAGRTGRFDEATGRYEGLVYMPCTAENGFIPEVPKEKVDIIYLCSPNNPTGAAATKEQLKMFVDYARKNDAVIIFDGAYAAFIGDDSLPRTIYEVEGAKACAIEVNSLSKSHGFTGIRLGWTVIPEEMKGIKAKWAARQSRHFNETSYPIQKMGVAALSDAGMWEAKEVIDFYMENARLIKEGVAATGLIPYGGENAPYIWAKGPDGIKSWDMFNMILSKYQIVGTPGSGFGPGGEGYFRFSAFGKRENIEKACARMAEQKLFLRSEHGKQSWIQ